MSKKNDKLVCVLDRFEESQAVLVFQLAKNNIQELVLPKRYLPKGVKKNSILHFEIFTDKLASLNQKKLAQHVLDEIINNNS